MSWNWNTDDEVKEYEVKGTVTISTEEYRDLIEKVAELKAKGQREHDDWYASYRECDELKKQLEASKKAVDNYNKYINSTDTRKSDYALYLRELRLIELENQNED